MIGAELDLCEPAAVHLDPDGGQGPAQQDAGQDHALPHVLLRHYTPGSESVLWQKVQRSSQGLFTKQSNFTVDSGSGDTSVKWHFL